MEIKKTLCSLIAGLIIAASSYGDIILPRGYKFSDRKEYYRFDKDITVTKISKGKKFGWLVYDTGKKEIIGDEENEIIKYKEYATMAEANRLMEILEPKDLREMASLYRRGLAGYELIYNIPNFVVQKGSRLEGLLLKAYITGGKNLPEEAQKRIITNLINEEKKEIIEEFYKKIFDNKEKVNPLQAAEIIKEYFLDTIEARMLNASYKLDRAAEISKKNRKEELNYKECEEFLNNFIEGNSTGRAYLKAIDRMQEDINWKSITQKIVKNLSDGLGIKDDIEKINMYTSDLLNVDLANILFGNEDFMNIFNDIEREYIRERASLFKYVEARYSLENGSISREIINDLNLNYNSHNKIKVNNPTPIKQKPVPIINLNPISGQVPLTIKIDISNSYDIGGKIVDYAIDIDDSDGLSADYKGSNLEEIIMHVYNTPGTKQITLEVKDNDGLRNKTTAIIDVKAKLPFRNVYRPANENTNLNGKIIFTSNRDGNKEIYAMNPDGSDQINLTNNPALEGNTVLSPDGSKIAFTSNRDGNFEIYVMNIDGSNQTRLTNNSASDIEYIWSPDSSKIAFRSGSYGVDNVEFYVINSDGGNQINLTRNLIYDKIEFDRVDIASWSSDSLGVCFILWRRNFHHGKYYIVNLNGDNQRKTCGRDVRLPLLSPDGSKRSIFDRIKEHNGDISDIYIADTIKLTDGTSYNCDPIWSPDGSKIAFTSNRDGNFEIYVMNIDGSNQTRLTNNSASDIEPIWTP